VKEEREKKVGKKDATEIGHLRRNGERHEYNDRYTTTWNRRLCPKRPMLHVLFATRTTTHQIDTRNPVEMEIT
jgi:hypothetical protein